MRQTLAALFLFVFFTLLSNAQPKKLDLLGHWRDSSVVGSSAYDNAFNEVWGLWVNGREYAIIGSTSGTHFIDVTDPANPFERALIPGASNGPHVIHRDYDDFQCYLYAVCDEGSSTLQVIDFSGLPDTLQVVYDSNEHLVRTHNIYIDIPKARLYTCAEATKTGFFALGVYDISDPVKPKFIGHYNKFGDITASHVHDAYAINDTVYLNCGPDGLAIMDFSDPADPQPILTLKPNEYPFSGYNHSGWLTPDRKTYIMADENHGLPLKVFDLTDIRNGEVISTLSPAADTSNAIPHNPLVTCDYAYVAYYYDGLQVYNIRNPKKPVLEAYYPTSVLPNKRSYKGAWGTYPYLPSGNILVADMQNGLFVIEGVEKACNSVFSCSPVSTDEQNETAGLKLHPNPAHDQVNIEGLSSVPHAHYSLMNSSGQLLRSGKLPGGSSRVTIPVENLPAGIYQLVIRHDDQILLRSSLVLWP